MQPIQYQTVRTPDLGQGIDSEAAQNHIQMGYSEDLLNADPKAAGQIEKRRGYQGYAGNLPVRVQKAVQSGTSLQLTLDTSIDLSSIRPSPIIIEGKFSNSNSGDFPSGSYSSVYYPQFLIDIKKIFATGVHSDVISQAQHTLTDPLIWGGATESTSLVDASNKQFILDGFSMNQSTKDITYNYTNGTGSPFTGYIFLKGRTPTTGSVFSGTQVVGTGTNTYTILAGTHNLSNHNVLAKVFIDTGTVFAEVVPDAVIIDDTTGNVSITLTNGTGAPFNGFFSLVAADTANFTTGSIGGFGTVSVTFSTAGKSPFAFVGCTLKNVSNLETVLPDSIVQDSSSQLITVTFRNQSSVGRVFNVFWDFGFVISDILTVTANNSATVTDPAPQLTIWGLDHSEIYGSMKDDHDGWVTHIDSYRSINENRVVTGLGGNIFAARTRDEDNNAVVHLMPLLYPRVNGTLNLQQVIGPAFYDTGETPLRTRGYITGDNGGFNYFTVTSVVYDTNNGWVLYTLTVPNMVVNGTLSTIISTVPGLEDRLTATQCGWAVHDGQFVIKQAIASSNTLQIWVQNSAVTSSDFDEPNAGGDAAIYTDSLTFTGVSVPSFLVGDLLLSGLFGANAGLVTINSGYPGTPRTMVNNVTSVLSLPAGLKVTAQRSSYVIPLRDAVNNSTNIDIVRGDMLTYSEVARQMRVKSVNPMIDTGINDISGNGTNATITLAFGTTNTLSVGDKVVVFGTTSYNGTQIVSNILSTTQFTVTSTNTAVGESGTLLGKTIEIDESLTFQDTELSTTFFTVPARWIPVELPTDTYDLTPKTRVSYFASNSYSTQPTLRSGMVQNNMYFANGDDEIFKFDGTNIYRAGLFRWQPGLFMSADATTAGQIVINTPALAYTANSQNKYTIALADKDTFSVGDILQDSNDTFFYTIDTIGSDTANAYIYVDRTISHGTAAGTVRKTATYQYYFRLNAVDANNNIIASAVTGANDNSMRLSQNASIRLRGLGLPAWDIYDYNRLDVQIYRTKANSVAPFYRVTTLQMKFDHNDGYFDYIDTDSDDDLRDLDEVNTALKGQEFGTAWQEPLRAKYVTSAGNRLVLANIGDYPQLDIQLLKKQNILTQSVFTNVNNLIWLFRKDDTDTSLTTDMVSRVNYVFRPVSAAVTVTGSTSVTGTSFTLSVANSAVSGSWVYLLHDSTHTTNNNLRFAGWWQVASATGGTITINNVNSDTSALAATDINKALFAFGTGLDVPVPIGTDYNYGMLNGNRTSTEPYEFLAIRRMADAIDASMRKVDTSLTAYATFKPWMIAGAGNEFNTGQLVLRQPRASTATFQVVIPALSGDFDVFINNQRFTGGSSASALSRQFPSRILISYPNYPEIFDNPITALDIDSDSAIDVNSADGQHITAVIPFFGQSTFGAALNSGVIIVFKTNSIYAVDLSQKASGLPCVQRLESRGMGCTAPYSVSLTLQGIIFANETGIYRLNKSLGIDFVGRKYERAWKFNINKDQIALATGTHDAYANAYKLSYPTLGQVENSHVAVYNHTREDVGVMITNSGYGGYGGYGSWTTYDNHSTTGWANLLSEAYYATTSGRVFKTRKLLDNTDYRDDSSPVNMSVTVAATDFGDAGKRKLVKYVTTHYQLFGDSMGTTLSTAVDLSTNFEPTDTFVIKENSNTNGLSDVGTNKVVTIQSSLATKKCVYLQVKYDNSTIDEPVVLSGVDYTVGGLTERGITQAASTK